MAFMDTLRGDEDEPIITAVSVHSPAIQNSKNGSFYTSYAINLKSNNSCFTVQQSCVRRRYSEFVHLRDLLKVQHPTLDPPLLPPKNYFNRFSNTFVAQRAEGLEIFLKKVLEIPVYLSNKGVHLFLQSQFTMPEIDKLVTGDIPTPQLIGGKVHQPSLLEESCSSLPSSGSTESSGPLPYISGSLSQPKGGCGGIISPLMKRRTASVAESQPIIISPGLSQNVMRTKFMCTVNSVLSDSSEKLSSSTSSSPGSEQGSTRRVSFNEKVTIAVVRNHLWNYAVKPIKAGAC